MVSPFYFMAELWRWTKEKTRAAGYFITRKNDIEKMVFEAINDDPWGPKNPEMQAIANKSLGNPEDCETIKKCLWEKMSDLNEILYVKKSLLLLEYLIRNGHESFRGEARQMIPQLQNLSTLQRFDVGDNAAIEAVIRRKAADIINLAKDDDLYRMEREKGAKLRGTISSSSNVPNTTNPYGSSNPYNAPYGAGFAEPENTLPSQSKPAEKKQSDEEYEEEELDFDPRAGKAAPAAPEPAPARRQIAPPPGRTNQQFDPFGVQGGQPAQAGADDLLNIGAAPAPAARPQQRQMAPPPAADDLLFGPSPAAAKPQPKPAADDFLNFNAPSAAPSAQYSTPQNQPTPAAAAKKPDMLSEFGDLVDLNLKGGQPKGYGKATTQMRGGPSRA